MVQIVSGIHAPQTGAQPFIRHKSRDHLNIGIMAVVEFSWNYHSEYEIDGFAVSRIKIDRFREFDQSRVTFLDAGDPTMRKCSTLVEPGTPESFTIVQASEYEVAWYFRVGTRQKFTKDFQAVFLTPSRRVT
jgi:hypothetical protein